MMTVLDHRLGSRREEGFTLIELVIVMLVIGILFAIALPIYINYQNQARSNAVKSDVRSTVTSITRYLDTNPGAVLTDLQNTTNVPIAKSGSASESVVISQDTSNTCTANGDASFFYIIKGADTAVGDTTNNYYSYYSCSGTYIAAGKFSNN